MGTTVLVARTLLRGLTPGRYPRGGSVHLRLWFTESWAAAAGAENLSCAPWTAQYARALGATIGRDVDLHALPPVTGMLTLGNGCAVEPEVDLRGHWLDGDVLRVGRVRIDKRATVGTRSTLAPGTRVGARAPRSRPGPRCSTPCRPASSGWGRPRCSTGRRGGTGRATRRPAAGAGWRRLRRDGRGARRRCRWSPPRAGCWWSASGCATRRRGPRRPRDALRAVPLGARHDGPRARRGHARVRAAARARVPRGVPRGAQPARAGRSGRRCGSWTTRAPRCSRSTRAWRRRVWLRALGRGHRQGRRGVDRPHAARR